MIDPDINDLGLPRKRLAEPYPRQFVTWQLGPIGSITLPQRMTEREWEFLTEWLRLSRPAFVE